MHNFREARFAVLICQVSGKPAYRTQKLAFYFRMLSSRSLEGHVHSLFGAVRTALRDDQANFKPRLGRFGASLFAQQGHGVYRQGAPRRDPRSH
jgi:hypothetical protein